MKESRGSNKEPEAEKNPEEGPRLGPGSSSNPVHQALFARKVRHHLAGQTGRDAPGAAHVTFTDGATTLKERGPDGEPELVDEQTEKAERVRQIIKEKFENTEKAVDDALKGAQGVILGDLINEQLPGSAIATVGRSLLQWLVDGAVQDTPLDVPLKIADIAREVVDNYEEKKEIVLSEKIADKLIADLTHASRSQLEAAKHRINQLRGGDWDLKLAALDGKVDAKPLVEPGAVAAHVRLLFEQILLPTLPARKQVDRIHHLAEKAIEAGEATEHNYGNRVSK